MVEPDFEDFYSNFSANMKNMFGYDIGKTPSDIPIEIHNTEHFGDLQDCYIAAWDAAIVTMQVLNKET
jgi:hypothetical protein|tara:strand:+ start:14895 stop:15098 length:204 start_codon:yes stop_codon:yes gene_type:complete